MNEKIQVARNRLMCSMLSLSVEGPGVQIHPGQNIFEGFTFYNAVIEGIKFNLSVHKNHRNPSRWQLNPAHVSSTVVRGGGYQELLPPDASPPDDSPLWALNSGVFSSGGTRHCFYI